MANSGGGTLVVGVREAGHSWSFEGVSPDQADSWETTRFNDFVNSYAEPPINCTLRTVECEGRLFVIVQVPPFTFTPHLAVKEYPKTLAKATLYVRTANNASAPVAEAADFNALIERAIKIRRGELLDVVFDILEDLQQAASRRGMSQTTEHHLLQVSRRAARATVVLQGAEVLWIDDHPENNLAERRILRSLNVFVDLARSTDEAITMLQHTRYHAVISDIARSGVQDEGLRYLRSVTAAGLHRPTIFYAQAFDEQRGTPPGAFGITNRPDQLLHYVMDVLERERG